MASVVWESTGTIPIGDFDFRNDWNAGSGHLIIDGSGGIRLISYGNSVSLEVPANALQGVLEIVVRQGNQINKTTVTITGVTTDLNLGQVGVSEDNNVSQVMIVGFTFTRDEEGNPIEVIPEPDDGDDYNNGYDDDNNDDNYNNGYDDDNNNGSDYNNGYDDNNNDDNYNNGNNNTNNNGNNNNEPPAESNPWTPPPNDNSNGDSNNNINNGNNEPPATNENNVTYDIPSLIHEDNGYDNQDNGYDYGDNGYCDITFKDNWYYDNGYDDYNGYNGDNDYNGDNGYNGYNGYDDSNGNEEYSTIVAITEVIPLSNMPQTGITDIGSALVSGFLVSTLVATYALHSISKFGKKSFKSR